MKTLATPFSVVLALSALGFVGVHGPDRQDSVLARPVVIGASLSAGLGAGKDLAQVLEARLGPDCGSIESSCSVLFWRDPIGTGASQASFALQRNPTVLIAIDFLFWFGYADRNLDGDPVTSESERLELMRRGLEMLEPFACPVLLADFPRDRGHVARMISPAHVPSPEAVQELNRELRRWSAVRSNVVLLPLASKLEEIRSGSETVVGSYPGREGTPRHLLQSDGVHLTLDGLVWVSQRVSSEMIARGWIEDFDVEQGLSSILGQIGDWDPPSEVATTRLELPRALGPAGR